MYWNVGRVLDIKFQVKLANILSWVSNSIGLTVIVQARIAFAHKLRRSLEVWFGLKINHKSKKISVLHWSYLEPLCWVLISCVSRCKSTIQTWLEPTHYADMGCICGQTERQTDSELNPVCLSTSWLGYKYRKHTRPSFYQQGLTWIPVWISNHMPSKVWNEITYSFPNFNCIVEVWEWITNFITSFIMYVMIYPCFK